MRTINVFLVAIAVSACGTPASPASADNDATGAVNDAPADAPVDTAAEVSATAEFVATLADFDCIKNGTKVGHFYVDNRLGQKDAAVAVAKANAKGAQYPLGTIIRLFPLEAMVKRGGKDFASTGGWEMFNLKIDGKAMAIVKRGGAEVSNASGSCAGCHTPAKDYDFVCGQDHGCAPIPSTPDLIDALQDMDPTCAK